MAWMPEGDLTVLVKRDNAPTEFVAKMGQWRFLPG